MTLIDKDALTAKAEFQTIRSKRGDCGAKIVTLWDIDNAPAIDAVEVRHGEWTVGYFQDLVCTACTHPSPCDKKTPYCPNCGAKMDGRRESEGT